MSAVEQFDRKFTEQEYFNLLVQSEVKYEFHDGTIVAMAGGKRAHNLAKRNFFFALAELKGPCKLYDSDTAVFIEQLNRYYFPDISLLCGEEEFTDEGGIERVLNPSLLIEVVSKSTVGKDQGEKLEAYKTLTSFKEYITVNSQSLLVTTYYKEDKGLWRIGSYYKLDQSVEIITLGVTIPMSVIYDGVEFEE
jgi:Uma2 family endonuclease